MIRKCGESRIVRLYKVLYLCTVILNYSNYGTRQETIKQQAKVRRGCNRRKWCEGDAQVLIL